MKPATLREDSKLGLRILVTGGAGMIGSCLARRLVAEGHEVKVVDNLWRGRLENLCDNHGKPLIDFDTSFYNRDLTEVGAIDDLLGETDYIFHLADIVAGINYVFEHQGSIFRQNFLINSNVIDSCRSSKIKGFIYVGTACSFPAHRQTGLDAEPLREEEQYPAAPESAYGWSKLMGEYEAFLMEKEVGIPVSVLSLHNVYGPPCEFGETSQVIPALIRKAIQFPKDPFIVWGSGAQGRAFVHVEDVVDALCSALEKGFGHGPIQIGPDVCVSIREVAETIIEVSGKNIELEFDRSKPEGDLGRCADFAKARKVLGWEPRREFRSGLAELYSWIEKRLE